MAIKRLKQNSNNKLDLLIELLIKKEIISSKEKKRIKGDDLKW